MSDGGFLPNIDIEAVLRENHELRQQVERLRSRVASMADRVSIALDDEPRICNKAQAFNLTELVAAIHNGAHGYGFRVRKERAGVNGQKLHFEDRETGNRWRCVVAPERRLVLVVSNDSRPAA